MDLRTAQWHKSSFSGDNGGHCVEVAGNLAGMVAVRDSKDPGGPTLVIPSDKWFKFLKSLKPDGRRAGQPEPRPARR
ncbi:hypothetical protein Sru01_09220 [Sphaerisporangium rufum]|uniref:DUF397 domain-containing protein n=1 Tax=Sphaerisporangium rufum TaxID=1381558 RepID=A0A919R021_9ACTN|nr:DUF397 domain-containing protein [Sphaerisporangium rufum]GII75940.1 hypothetical protein Sru01_09220 [Sphaerisporangium rufum]